MKDERSVLSEHITEAQVLPQTAGQWLLYVAGIAVLALGIVLNTKTTLGLSPIISVPHAIAAIWKLSFPLMTFLVYTLFVILEFVLKGKNRTWIDLLQLPFSLVFSLLLDFYDKGYDRLLDTLGISLTQLWQKLLLLLVAMVITAFGVFLMITTHGIPNPADGLANTIGVVLGKGMGLGKNILDITSVIVTCALGLLNTGKIIDIGIGTLIAMVCVGRILAGMQYLYTRHRVKYLMQSEQG